MRTATEDATPRTPSGRDGAAARTDLHTVKNTITPHRTQFERVFHQIDDAVVEFEIVDSDEQSSSGSRTASGDGEPIIVDANHAFRDIFSPDMKRVIGLPLNSLIVPASKQDEARAFDQRTSAGESNVAFVQRSTTAGKRTFLYRGIPYEDNRGFAIYTDVTDERQQQADLTEIVALASQLCSTAESDETVETAAQIREIAASLVQFHATDDLD